MRIVIGGYYGFGNFGDELILSLLLRQVRKRWPTARARVLSADPADTLRTHRTEAVNRWNPAAVLWELLRSRIFIFGGGGLIQDRTSSRSLVYYALLVLAARWMGCRVFAYGVGAEGPLKGGSAFLVRLVFGTGSVVLTVRDRDSKEVLASCGIHPERIHISSDPAFLLLGELPEGGPAGGSDSPPILIPRYPVEPHHINVYRHIIKELESGSGHPVWGLLFQPEKERAVFEAQFPQVRWFAHNFSEKSPRLSGMRMLQEARVIVSARFHGCLLAMGLRRPFVGFGDEQKVGRFCREWRRPFLPWEMDPTEMIRTLRSAQNQGDSGADRNKLLDAKKRAEGIFETISRS